MIKFFIEEFGPVLKLLIYSISDYSRHPDRYPLFAIFTIAIIAVICLYAVLKIVTKKNPEI